MAAPANDAGWNALTEAERAEVRARASQSRGERSLAAMKEALAARPQVIIDLAFDELMTDRQIVSLAQQLGFCHAATKRSRAAGHPALTHCLSSYCGRLAARLPLVHGSSSWPVARHSDSYLNVAASHGLKAGSKGLVYLTAEGEEVLSCIDPESTYVIGGLVDRNQHVGIVYRRAQAHGVCTARLPLAEYAPWLKRDGRALTVNQCFEMLTLRAEGRLWEEVILETLPPRRRERLGEGR